LSRAIRDGKSTFEAAGPRAYFEDPAAASAEEGRERSTCSVHLEEAGHAALGL
jgi:hypothetical protein